MDMKPCLFQLCSEVEKMRMQLSNEIEAHEATQDQLAHDLSSSKESLQQVRAQLQLAEKVRRESSSSRKEKVEKVFHFLLTIIMINCDDVLT